MEVGDCRKVTLWERQRHQSSWITNRKKISRATDTAIAPNGIIVQHCRKHRDKIECKCGIVQSESTETNNSYRSKGENSRHSTRRRWHLISHQMEGVLRRNWIDLVTILICGSEKDNMRKTLSAGNNQYYWYTLTHLEKLALFFWIE